MNFRNLFILVYNSDIINNLKYNTRLYVIYYNMYGYFWDIYYFINW